MLLKKFAGYLVVIICILGVVLGTNKMGQKVRVMLEKCIKTDLYVIGDKGHRNRIYDCSGVKLDQN